MTHHRGSRRTDPSRREGYGSPRPGRTPASGRSRLRGPRATRHRAAAPRRCAGRARGSRCHPGARGRADLVARVRPGRCRRRTRPRGRAPHDRPGQPTGGEVSWVLLRATTTGSRQLVVPCVAGVPRRSQHPRPTGAGGGQPPRWREGQATVRGPWGGPDDPVRPARRARSGAAPIRRATAGRDRGDGRR